MPGIPTMAGRRLVAAVVVLCAVYPAGALAWGGLGHDVICRIAWQETSAAGRALVRDLAAVSTADSFARLCMWADEVRRSPGYGWSRPHHYVNAKRNHALDPRADCPTEGCILRALGQQGRVIADAARGDRSRVEALKFIAHYVGDLHQPMHVGYGEDAGGNGIAVRFCPRSCWRSIDNLHQVWDSALLKAASPSKAPALSDRLRRSLTAQYRVAWRKGNVIDWAQETYAVAAGMAYRSVRDGKLAGSYLGDSFTAARLGADYTALMRPVALAQLQKAGVRLAAVLDALARGETTALGALPSLTVTPTKGVSSYTVVRTAAASSAEVIGELAVGQRAELLGREQQWYRVRLADRREGYVRINKVYVP